MAMLYQSKVPNLTAEQLLAQAPAGEAGGFYPGYGDSLIGNMGIFLTPQQAERILARRPDVAAASGQALPDASPQDRVRWWLGGAIRSRDTDGLRIILEEAQRENGQPISNPDQILAMFPEVKKSIISQMGGPEGSDQWPATRFLREWFRIQNPNSPDPNAVEALRMMAQMPGQAGFTPQEYPNLWRYVQAAPAPAPAPAPPGAAAPPPGAPATPPTAGGLAEPARSYLARNPQILQQMGVGQEVLYNEYAAREALQGWVQGAGVGDERAKAVLAAAPSIPTLSREQAEQQWLASQGLTRDPGTGQIAPTLALRQYESQLKANPRNYVEYFEWLRGAQPPPQPALAAARQPGEAQPVPAFMQQLLAGQIPSRTPTRADVWMGLPPDLRPGFTAGTPAWRTGEKVPVFGTKAVSNLTPDERAALESEISAGGQEPNDWYSTMQRLGPQGTLGGNKYRMWLSG